MKSFIIPLLKATASGFLSIFLGISDRGDDEEEEEFEEEEEIEEGEETEGTTGNSKNKKEVLSRQRLFPKLQHESHGSSLNDSYHLKLVEEWSNRVPDGNLYL